MAPQCFMFHVLRHGCIDVKYKTPVCILNAIRLSMKLYTTVLNLLVQMV